MKFATSHNLKLFSSNQKWSKNLSFNVRIMLMDYFYHYNYLLALKRYCAYTSCVNVMIVCYTVLISRYLPVYISLISQLTITNISHKHHVPSNINNIILLLYLRPKKKSILAKLQRSSHDVISIESKVSSHIQLFNHLLEVTSAI